MQISSQSVKHIAHVRLQKMTFRFITFSQLQRISFIQLLPEMFLKVKQTEDSQKQAQIYYRCLLQIFPSDLQNMALRQFINKRCFETVTCLLLATPPFYFKEDDKHQSISIWSLLQMWEASHQARNCPLLQTEGCPRCGQTGSREANCRALPRQGKQSFTTPASQNSLSEILSQKAKECSVNAEKLWVAF